MTLLCLLIGLPHSVCSTRATVHHQRVFSSLAFYVIEVLLSQPVQNMPLEDLGHATYIDMLAPVGLRMPHLVQLEGIRTGFLAWTIVFSVATSDMDRYCDLGEICEYRCCCVRFV